MIFVIPFERIFCLTTHNKTKYSLLITFISLKHECRKIFFQRDRNVSAYSIVRLKIE